MNDGRVVDHMAGWVNTGGETSRSAMHIEEFAACVIYPRKLLLWY